LIDEVAALKQRLAEREAELEKERAARIAAEVRIPMSSAGDSDLSSAGRRRPRL
jgi:hypothetical protein